MYKLLLGFLLLCVSSFAFAQEPVGKAVVAMPDPKEQAEAPPKELTPEEQAAEITVKLKITPAVPGRPALKDRLFYRPIDQEPGNAAPIYLKAAILMADIKPEESFWEHVNDWLETSPAKLPRDKVRTALQQYQTVLKQVRLAARREECQWNTTFRQDWLNTLLPELNHLGSFSKLLALTARLQIADRDFAGAVETMRVEMTMAQHVSSGQTFINGLVATAFVHQVLEQVAELSQEAGGPNFYWPLTALPKPFINLSAALDVEGDLAYFGCPDLHNVQQLQLSKEEWDARLQGFQKSFAKLLGLTNVSLEAQTLTAPMESLRAAATLIYIQRLGRQWMIDSGMKKEVVDQKPASEIILKYIAFTYEDAHDSMVRWFSLPYPEARAWILKEEKTFAENRFQEPFPLAGILLPAMHMVMQNTVKVDRKIAAQRCVEALRMYAAGHDGKLPQQLADVKEVPIPGDPFTGKPFDYQVQEDHALLIGAPFDGKSWLREGLRYEISVAK